MNSTNFLSEIRKQAVCSAGQNNINATKMKNMEVPAPDLKDQQKLLKEIMAHETKRRKAQIILAAAADKKRQILLDSIK